MKLTSRIKQSGFTLIELLIVIGILAILLALTLIALNPSRNFADANNTQRRSDVSAILNSVSQYAAANKGALPPSLSTATATPTAIGSAAGNINLCADVVPNYLADLPTDPSTGTRVPTGSTCTAATTYLTGYTVAVSATGSRVTIAAPGAQNSVTISVAR